MLSGPILIYLLRRVAIGVGLLLLVSIIVFLAVTVLPGDAATAVLGRNATPERLAALQEKMNLDQPPAVRYFMWLGGVLQGDLGTSLSSNQPVADLLLPRLRNSLILAGSAALIMIPLGIWLGALAGSKAATARDRTVSTGSLVFLSTPDFVIATGMIVVFATWLHVLPPVSLFDPLAGPWSRPIALALPVLTLVISGTGYIVRIVRASVASAMQSDIVTQARLNGYPERVVVRQFALRNALAAVIQVSALMMLYLIAGVVVIEMVFSYPGIGQLAVSATTSRDFVLLQSLILFSAAIFIAVNILTDLGIHLVTPRLRTGQ